MRNAALISFVLVQACAVAPPIWTPAARPSAATCNAPGAPDSTPWQLVMGQGFTFCVPATWQSSDRRTWRSGGSLIGWCTETLAQCPRVQYEFIGQIITDPSQEGAAAIADEGNPCSGDHYKEIVSGASADLEDWRCNGHHVTSAVWFAQKVFFFGQTEDAVTARLQLQVYRTVRFVLAAAH
jgi:hypothetical protein